MPRRLVNVIAVMGLATVITVVIALPVVRAPSDRVFGMEIVGRHHDPFTVMAQFANPASGRLYSQPLTDVPGAILSLATGPVAAYNWLVLLTFPLSAATAYLLARHLTLSRAGAIIAALAFAFSPFHLAQAAYHPHIAQTQWMPLYLLALWRCADRPSLGSIGLLSAAAVAVALSNFYGGFIAGVITPVALGAYWIATRNAFPRPLGRLAVTTGALALMAAAGLAYAALKPGALLVTRVDYAFPREQLFAYGATWWSYLVPPVEHPLLGDGILRFWHSLGVREGLLEQQLSLGWGTIVLSMVAIVDWLVRDGPSRTRRYTPVLVIVALTAFWCSLPPQATVGAFTFPQPSSLLFDVVPMFRAYARFGGLVQLMVALLAGIGIAVLMSTRRTSARIACVLLVALIVGEYVVKPSALSRDVLPTTAHRWVMDQPGLVQVLDCVRFDPPSASVPWLTEHRVVLLGEPFSDCSEANLGDKLAAGGFTHLLVRRGSADAATFDRPLVPNGLRIAARFKDGQVLVVTALRPTIYTAAMTGFSSREHEGGDSWRWMGARAAWTIVNTSQAPVVASLDVELSAFHVPRQLELQFRGRTIQTVGVGRASRLHAIGPFTIPPGTHQVTFHPVEAPTVGSDVAGNSDTRQLSVAVRTWRWTIHDPFR